jgi:multisubunit Na+/H+ antiporter MnhG subunit
MNSNELSLLLGTALSLIFTFAPGLRDWYEQIEAKQRAQVMALGIIVISVCVVAASCAGIDASVSCTRDGVAGFFKNATVNALLALASNQTAHAITKRMVAKG